MIAGSPTAVGTIAVDTSVAVPLLVPSHARFADTAAWSRGRRLVLTAHSLAETYSVLTRLPGDLAAAPADVARVLDATFGEVVTPSTQLAAQVHRILADARIAGGAVYDGLVALAARDAGLPLATRDARARTTYEALGVTVEVVPSR